MSTIGGISGNALGAYYGLGNAQRSSQRSDPAQVAEDLFARLSSEQGYIDQTSLQTAVSQATNATTTPSTTSSAFNADSLFSFLDSDGDERITEQEFLDRLKQVAQQFEESITGTRGQEGMPPPPPLDGADGTGYTKEELTGLVDELSSSDSKRADLMSDLVANFEAADSDGDGRVTLAEAVAFDRDNRGGLFDGNSTNSVGTRQSATATAEETATGDTQAADTQIRLQLARLMQAYGLANGSATSNEGALSLSA